MGKSSVVRLFLFGLCFVPSTVQAFAPARPKEPADTKAYPARVVSMGKFLDTKFKLPDGKTTVDAGFSLAELVLAEMPSMTKKFIPRPQEIEPVSRFVMYGGITSFEAENSRLGIRIGYHKGLGEADAGIIDFGGVDGKATLSIGALGVSFYIYDTVRGMVVAAANGDGLVGNGKIEVTVDLMAMQPSADYQFKTQMKNAFLRALKDAVNKMAKEEKTNELMDWTAHVVGVNLESKRVVFDAGTRDEVQKNNVFSVYDNSGMRIGEVKVRDASNDQSSASLKNDSGDKLLNSVRVGDTIKIY